MRPSISRNCARRQGGSASNIEQPYVSISHYILQNPRITRSENIDQVLFITKATKSGKYSLFLIFVIFKLFVRFVVEKAHDMAMESIAAGNA
jgi:hypothetical protein